MRNFVQRLLLGVIISIVLYNNTYSLEINQDMVYGPQMIYLSLVELDTYGKYVHLKVDGSFSSGGTIYIKVAGPFDHVSNIDNFTIRKEINFGPTNQTSFYYSQNLELYSGYPKAFYAVYIPKGSTNKYISNSLLVYAPRKPSNGTILEDIVITNQYGLLNSIIGEICKAANTADTGFQILSDTMGLVSCSSMYMFYNENNKNKCQEFAYNSFLYYSYKEEHDLDIEINDESLVYSILLAITPLDTINNITTIVNQKCNKAFSPDDYNPLMYYLALFDVVTEVLPIMDLPISAFRKNIKSVMRSLNPLVYKPIFLGISNGIPIAINFIRKGEPDKCINYIKNMDNNLEVLKINSKTVNQVSPNKLNELDITQDTASFKKRLLDSIKTNTIDGLDGVADDFALLFAKEVKPPLNCQSTLWKKRLYQQNNITEYIEPDVNLKNLSTLYKKADNIDMVPLLSPFTQEEILTHSTAVLTFYKGADLSFPNGNLMRDFEHCVNQPNGNANPIFSYTKALNKGHYADIIAEQVNKIVIPKNKFSVPYEKMPKDFKTKNFKDVTVNNFPTSKLVKRIDDKNARWVIRNDNGITQYQHIIDHPDGKSTVTTITDDTFHVIDNMEVMNTKDANIGSFPLPKNRNEMLYRVGKPGQVTPDLSIPNQGKTSFNSTNCEYIACTECNKNASTKDINNCTINCSKTNDINSRYLKYHIPDSKTMYYIFDTVLDKVVFSTSDNTNIEKQFENYLNNKGIDIDVPITIPETDYDAIAYKSTNSEIQDVIELSNGNSKPTDFGKAYEVNVNGVLNVIKQDSKIESYDFFKFTVEKTDWYKLLFIHSNNKGAKEIRCDFYSENPSGFSGNVSLSSSIYDNRINEGPTAVHSANIIEINGFKAWEIKTKLEAGMIINCEIQGINSDSQTGPNYYAFNFVSIPNPTGFIQEGLYPIWSGKPEDEPILNPNFNSKDPSTYTDYELEAWWQHELWKMREADRMNACFTEGSNISDFNYNGNLKYLINDKDHSIYDLKTVTKVDINGYLIGNYYDYSKLPPQWHGMDNGDSFEFTSYNEGQATYKLTIEDTSRLPITTGEFFTDFDIYSKEPKVNFAHVRLTNGDLNKSTYDTSLQDSLIYSIDIMPTQNGIKFEMIFDLANGYNIYVDISGNRPMNYTGGREYEVVQGDTIGNTYRFLLERVVNEEVKFQPETVEAYNSMSKEYSNEVLILKNGKPVGNGEAIQVTTYANSKWPESSKIYYTNKNGMITIKDSCNYAIEKTYKVYYNNTFSKFTCDYGDYEDYKDINNTLLTQSDVSQLYIVILGRASEGSGNKYWQSINRNMASTANYMLETETAKAYFGGTLNSNQAFVEHIYYNTFNKRLIDDQNGIAYWVTQLNHGLSKGHFVTYLLTAIKEYYPGEINYNPNDFATNESCKQLTNRTIVSNYMANNVEDAPNNYDIVLSFTYGLHVTSDSNDISYAISIIDDMIPNTPVPTGPSIIPEDETFAEAYPNVSGYSSWKTANEYQTLFDRNVNRNCFPVEVNGIFNWEINAPVFRAKFVNKPQGEFYFMSHHGIIHNDWVQFNNSYINQGYNIYYRGSYVTEYSGTLYYQTVWVKGSGVENINLNNCSQCEN